MYEYLPTKDFKWNHDCSLTRDRIVLCLLKRLRSYRDE